MFKNRIILTIKRGNNELDIHYMGKKIGTICVSESNRGNSCTLEMHSNIEDTRFFISNKRKQTVIDDDFFNKEEFNK